MRRLRNTQQKKEQHKNPQDQTNEEEIGSLPKKDFRVVIVKMVKILGNRMEKIQETFNKDLEEQKSKQTMTKNIINEIYLDFSSVRGIFPRIDHILADKSSLGKFKKIEIVPRDFSDHNAMRLDFNYRK